MQPAEIWIVAGLKRMIFTTSFRSQRDRDHFNPRSMRSSKAAACFGVSIRPVEPAGMTADVFSSSS
jgi:hypothetical protein